MRKVTRAVVEDDVITNFIVVLVDDSGTVQGMDRHPNKDKLVEVDRGVQRGTRRSANGRFEITTPPVDTPAP